MREIIGEKTEYKKIINYFLKLLDVVDLGFQAQDIVFST
tara:strand:- start:237 stop:353 length:117 start_codon:yes stop_codon:yes gene_type:complete